MFMFDGTHLSNWAGAITEWPGYMTIGNLSSKIRPTPTTHSVVMVALLPIPIKNRNIPQKRLDEQRQTNWVVLNEVLRRVLQPLTFKQHPCAERGYYNVLWPDGNFRRCEPVLSAWLADCPEYSDLHHLERHVCFWCVCPKNELGDCVHPDKQYPRRDHNLYRTLSDAHTKGAEVELLSRHVHRGFNVFRHIPCIVSDFPKPAHLHTMSNGMLDHLQKWIFHFMKTHERRDKYSAIWLSVPAYHDLTLNTKSYEEVSQWNGKEMKEMSWYLFGVVTHSLRGGSPAQGPIFNRAIECTRALLELYMYARYKSRDDASFSYMEDALHRFHTVKDVFSLGQAGNKAKAKANAVRTELVKKRKVDEETNAATWIPSKKRREMNAWRDYITHKIDISNDINADFNCLKIHLMAHWAEQIRWYGALQQYSAERHEQSHKTNLKDGWNASNHNLNYLPQVIAIQRRILSFDIRELHLQSLAQRRESSAAACKVFPSSADLPAPLRAQLYKKPEFMGLQTWRDGKHPDAMFQNFRALLDNTQDAAHRAAIYSGMQEFIKHKSGNTTYTSDEQLHAIELCIYHGIKVPNWGFRTWTNIWDMSMHRKPELARRGSMERLGVGTATPREVLWCAEWASAVATATTIQDQAPKQGWSFCRVLVSPGYHHNTWKLG